MHGRVEKELFKHLGGGYPAFGGKHIFGRIPYIVDYSLSRIHGLVLLGKKTYLYGVAALNRSAVGRKSAGQYVYEGRLSAAVGAYYSYTVVLEDDIAEIVYIFHSVEGFAYIFGDYCFSSHP